MKLIRILACSGAIVLLLSASVLADGDVAKGKVVFKKCIACHDAVEEKKKVGPHLVGVVGRVAGTVEGFKYSKNMVELGEGGLVWTEENLAAYLRNPKDVVPKGTMPFAGLKDDDDIADVIEYLKADPKP